MLADKLINNLFLEEGEATAAAGFSGAAMATPGAGMTPPGSSFA
jgi:hypothetical protein